MTNTTTRLSVLEARAEAIDAKLDTLLGLLSDKAVTPERTAAPKAKASKARKTRKAAPKAKAATPAKATRKGKARRTPNRKPVVGGTVEGKRCLTSKNRVQFIADHDWATNPHASTRDLARAVVVDGQPLVGAWEIGPRYREILGGGAPTVAVVEPARKARTERAPEPKYGTKAWIRWARPTDEGAPRRADGSVTPKSEWKARMALADSGKFSAKEIDAAMAAK